MPDISQELLTLYKEERERNDRLVNLLLEYFGLSEKGIAVRLPEGEAQQVIGHGKVDWRTARSRLERISRKGPATNWSEKAEEVSKELEENAG